jgi:anti-sigma28 factor (negative regulator of flagellin synthesis)
MTTPDRIRKPLPPIRSREPDVEELPESPNEIIKAGLIRKAIRSGDYKMDEKLTPAIEKMLEEESL